MKYVLIAESANYEKLLAIRETETECEEIAYDMEWGYTDENGFSWNLYVSTYEEWIENHPLYAEQYK